MGILQRAFKIAKALVTGKTGGSSASDFEKEELRKIVEELNNSTPRANYQTKNTNQRKQNAENPSPNITEIKVRNAYKTLGLKPSASNTEIKSAYRNLIRQYHPDVVSHLSRDQQAQAMKKSQEINVAYEFLQQIRKF
ncbi:MAG: DnaJ domain-containing protein [Bacteriodetes bacterium]|nr:DnaJ domain-containing protein [Bacteroidota bacterium]